MCAVAQWHLLGRLSELVDHEGAEQRGLEERAQRGRHAAQHQQTLVVVVIEPSRVQHLRQVRRDTTTHVTLYTQFQVKRTRANKLLQSLKNSVIQAEGTQNITYQSLLGTQRGATAKRDARDDKGERGPLGVDVEVVDIFEETGQVAGVLSGVAEDANQQPGASGDDDPVLLAGVEIAAVVVSGIVASDVLFWDLVYSEKNATHRNFRLPSRSEAISGKNLAYLFSRIHKTSSNQSHKTG